LARSTPDQAVVELHHPAVHDHGVNVAALRLERDMP
jgi:hypothetical protein